MQLVTSWSLKLLRDYSISLLLTGREGGREGRGGKGGILSGSLQ